MTTRSTFPQITAQRVRALMTRTETFGIGLKEIQIFDQVDCTGTVTSSHAGPVRITGTTTRVAVAGTRVSRPLDLVGNSTGSTPTVVADNR
ncbi:MAG: hypothetical protein ACRDVN_05505 [Jiangellaceae bacterium]